MNNQPIKSSRFWVDLLIHPGKAFSVFVPNFWLTVLLILVLIVISVLRVTVTASEPGLMLPALLTTAFGVLTVWISLCLLFHAVSLYLGAEGKFFDFVSYMALASLPVSLMTLVSLILYRPFPIGWFHTLIGLVGMAWGWPGFFTYLALVHGEKLNPRIAGIFVVVVMILISFGWFLPAIVSLFTN